MRIIVDGSCRMIFLHSEEPIEPPAPVTKTFSPLISG